MTTESREMIEKVMLSKDKDLILAYCLGWLENHFETRESVKKDEIIKMLTEALKSNEKLS